MATKTNAVRLVQQAGISCREAFYLYDENDLNGNHAAEAIGFDPESVFKTLVTKALKPELTSSAFRSAASLTLKKRQKQPATKALR